MNRAFTIGATILISLSLAACGSKNNSNSNNRTTSTKVSPKYHKLGDTVKVGKVTYTLKSVEVTNERNEFEDNQPKYVIKVIYHVKNNSDKELPIGADLDAYGPNNNKLKSYPVNDTTLDSIAAGKEADVTTGFGSDKLGTFELQFSPLVSTEKPVKFRVKVKENNSTNSSSTQDNTVSNQQATDTSQSINYSNKTQPEINESKSATVSSNTQSSTSIPSDYYNEDAYKDTYKANLTPEQRYAWDSEQAERGAQQDRELGLEP
ncbi:hypothetical protein CP354_02060 [Lactobacillus sp. UMNPBX3]|nr:hypothetical protein CP354_02060 [Lactobacillus sp. UMNPBX3]